MRKNDQSTTVDKAAGYIDPAKQYERARHRWDSDIIRHQNALGMWRALALLSVGALVLCIYFMGSYMQKPRLLPYVVEVQGDQVSFKGMMRSTPLTINDAVVRNYLTRFITNLRTISSDLVILKGNLRDCYSIASTNAARQITEMIGKDKPFELSRNELRRDIEITLFEKMGERTWRVEWLEEIREQGSLKDTFSMAGTFTFAQQDPPTDIEAEKNPFGLYFTEFFISQRRGTEGGQP
jgi:type IV secretion system protein VirB5